MMIDIREKLKHLSDHFKKQLHPTKANHEQMVREGIILFREEAVFIVTSQAEQIEAKVANHFVDLELNEPLKSKCTCGHKNKCKHLLATFFYVLSKDVNVLKWLQEWKQEHKMTDLLSTLKRGSDLLTVTSINEKDGPERWVQMIQDCFQQKAPQHPFQLEEWARATYRRLLKYSPVNQEWQPLYQLFASYESLKIIIDLWTKQLGDRSKFTSRLDAFSQYMVSELEVALSHLNTVATPFAFDPYYRYLREHSATLLEKKTFYPKGLLDAYFLLWSSLFIQRSVRYKEFERLQKIGQSDKNDRIKIAIIHLAILLKKDKFALNQIAQFGSGIAPYALQWIRLLQTEQPPKRLATYLIAFLKQIQTYLTSKESKEKTQFTQAFFHSLDDQLVKKLDRSLIEKAYRMLLPMSRYQYAAFLLEKKQYRKWTELQATTLLFNLDYTESSTIELIEKNDPNTLFPLYHHTISDLINSRNRPNYKRAVTYLKQLHLLYKKEQKLSDWERYWEHLLKSTKRLRAFQEECRKGKLVTDESR